MTNLVIKKPLSIYLPVAGSESNFPVRRVYCIGRNYAEHAREMGHDCLLYTSDAADEP